ncbi:MAG: efflux RND transporter periplasmic adaptor subunit [Xanthomonadales bacterium]|nr:efflux RND transporter periplasmic adaptor subunit [Xanthomonadales bacterium]
MKRQGLGLIFGSALLAGGYATAQDGFPPARVEVATAEIRELAPTVDVNGSVVSLNDSRIATEVEGVLAWLADVGASVEAGEEIARIDPRLMNVAAARARANVSRLEADLAFREQQLKRARDLAATRNASETLLDESLAQRDAARFELAEARAQLELAEGNLERTTIRAPFAGHVTQRLASVGEYVNVGEDVLRLVDTHRLEISLNAPIALTEFVRPGASVQVRSGQRARSHAIRTVVPVGDAVSRMVEIRLRVAEGDWLVGTPVQVSLPAADPVTTVAVPRDALVERGGSTFVYRINDSGSADQISAEIQATVGLWVGLSGGVEAGDQVIIRGAERLAPGQPVAIIDES